VASLPDPALVLVTDDDLSALDMLAYIEAALQAGCRIVQLRRPRASGRELYDCAVRLRKLTASHGALLLVNDRIDVALTIGADGVHLPGSGMASQAARRLVARPRLLGRAVHSVEEVDRERRLGEVDYVQLGPIFDTPSKRAFGAPQGLDKLREAVAVAGELSVVAVGGIDTGKSASVVRAGARGIAVIRAISHAKDAGAATQGLLAAMAAKPR